MEEEIRRYHKLVAVAIFVSLMSACGGKWKDMAWGYRALHWTQVAGEATDKSVAAWVNLKNAECAHKHKVKTAEFATCAKATLKLVRSWTGCENMTKKVCKGGVLPALQEAQKAAHNALDAIYNGTSTKDIKTVVRPAVCALVRAVGAVKAAGVDLGKAKASIDKVLVIGNTLCK